MCDCASNLEKYMLGNLAYMSFSLKKKKYILGILVGFVSGIPEYFGKRLDVWMNEGNIVKECE